MLLAFCILLIVAGYLFYRWAVANNDYFEKRGIPYSKPTFLLGNFAKAVFRRKSLFDIFVDLYNEHDAKISGVFDQRKPVFLLRDPEVVKQITIKDFDHFVNHRSIFDDDEDVNHSGNLFAASLVLMKDGKWKDMRSTLSPAYTGSKMRQMFQLMNEVAQDTSVYMKQKEGVCSKDGLDVDVKDFITRFTNDVIASTAFGLKVNSYQNEKNEFYMMGKKVTTPTAKQLFKFAMYSMFKKLMKKLDIPLVDKKVNDYFMRLVLDTMKYRQENNIIRPDMINILMEAKGMVKSDKPKPIIREWSDVDIVGQCFIFFLAGFETSAALSCFTAHELMENPDVQDKLLQEILEVEQSLDGKPLSYETLQNMRYMDMVIQECLRKWPPAMVTDRVCNKDITYNLENGEKLELKKGDSVWIPIVGFHRDSKFFENPNKFDPERFSEANKDNMKPLTYLPFGVGPRNLFIEKLLRSTDVSKVYVLTRPKAGADINERFTKIFKDPLFEKLCTIKPNPMKYIQPIAGDCTLPNLGISSAEDRRELIENVDIVIHVAATVRFNEPLSNATQINVQATVDLIDLAKEMKKLKSFVHVSSAFANCLVLNASEKYYTEYLGTTSDKLLQIKNVLGNEMLDRMEGEIVGKFPNTYCLTKSVAEEAVLNKANNLPISIFRPGIILPTCDEPLTGWIDNLYGPMSVLYGCAYGVLRVMYGCPTNKAGLVPVDYCANMLLACGWYTATNVKQIPTSDPPIYSLVPDESNTLEWGDYKKYVEMHGVQIPLSAMIWYPFLIFANKMWKYNILCFIYHTLPGYLIDFLLLIIGKKPRMSKAYKKIHKQCGLLQYFLDNDFTFDTTNAKQLWRSMSPEDQRLFKFDMTSMNWDNYFYNSLFGLRRFLAKEDPDTIPKAKKLLKRLYVLHCAIQGLVCLGTLWLLWSIFNSIFLPFFV